MYFLGFDIGGSSVKAVLIKEGKPERKPVAFRVEKLPRSFRKLNELIASMTGEFAAAIGSKKIGGVGFSIAGAINKKRDRMLLSPNIPYLNKKPLLKIFGKSVQPHPLIIGHDAHCFLLAELKMGIAKKFKNVFYFTLGTGIGGAFMIDGQIIAGNHGSAGEVGQTIVNLAKGTKLEDVGANKFIRKNLRIRYSIAKQKALSGNKKAVRIFKSMGKNLGIGIANVINIFDPEAIIISGGLSSAKELILPVIKERIARHVLSEEARKTKVLWSKMGRFGGALGAALLAQDNKKR